MYLDNKVAIIRSLHFRELSHAKVKLIIFFSINLCLFFFCSACRVIINIFLNSIYKNMERFTNLRVILAQGPC